MDSADVSGISISPQAAKRAGLEQGGYDGSIGTDIFGRRRVEADFPGWSMRLDRTGADAYADESVNAAKIFTT